MQSFKLNENDFEEIIFLYTVSGNEKITFIRSKVLHNFSKHVEILHEGHTTAVDTKNKLKEYDQIGINLPNTVKYVFITKEKNRVLNVESNIKTETINSTTMKKKVISHKDLNEQSKEFAFNVGVPWSRTEEEYDLLFTGTPEDAVKVLGRTYYAITAERSRIKTSQPSLYKKILKRLKNKQLQEVQIEEKKIEIPQIKTVEEQPQIPISLPEPIQEIKTQTVMTDNTPKTILPFTFLPKELATIQVRTRKSSYSEEDDVLIVYYRYNMDDLAPVLKRTTLALKQHLNKLQKEQPHKYETLLKVAEDTNFVKDIYLEKIKLLHGPEKMKEVAETLKVNKEEVQEPKNNLHSEVKKQVIQEEPKEEVKAQTTEKLKIEEKTEEEYVPVVEEQRGVALVVDPNVFRMAVGNVTLIFKTRPNSVNIQDNNCVYID